MAPLSRGAFRSLVGGLDAGEFAAFVAALWRARDRAVEREGSLLVVDGERRIWVESPGRWPLVRRADPPPEADVVVTRCRGRPPGAGDRRVVDADDLYELALYGIDRGACTDIFERFFDRPPAERASRTLPTAALGAAAVALAVVAAALVVATGVGLPVLDDRGQRGAEYAGRAGGLVTNMTDAGEVSSADIGGASVGGGPGVDRAVPAVDNLALGAVTGFPPGVSPRGVVDAEALAAAHADRTAGRQYRLTLVQREFVGGNRTGVAREVVHVGPNTTARAVETEGEFRRDPLIIDTPPRRGHPGRWRPGQEPYASRVERYLGWFLSVRESSVERTFVRDGRRFYVLSLSGEPWGGATDVTGTALVDETGVVHALRRSATIPGTNVSTVVTIRYEFADAGATNATAPSGSPPRWAGA
ncbi:MAG: hypothetical protein ABEH77_07455 [Halobacteriaceae archaeon]